MLGTIRRVKQAIRRYRMHATGVPFVHVGVSQQVLELRTAVMQSQVCVRHKAVIRNSVTAHLYLTAIPHGRTTVRARGVELGACRNKLSRVCLVRPARQIPGPSPSHAVVRYI